MVNKARCIGVTGGIGSGKTTVCRIFEVLDIPIYYADKCARTLMVEDPDLVASIRQAFGPKAYMADGGVNREHLGRTVFSDSNKLERLNKLVHPVVGRDFAQWRSLPRQQRAAYTIKEAALLFEAGSYRDLEATIAVLAPEKLKTDRVLLRDSHRDIGQVRQIIERQMDDHEMARRADHVIHNDGRRALIPQVLALHDIFKKWTLPK